MKDIYKQYKPFFMFLARFMGSYIVLFFIYKIYLASFDTLNNEPDKITYLVANNCEWFLNFLGYKSHVALNSFEPCLNLFCGPNNYYVRIVEGCNAVSVMILFVSFCIAFSSQIIRTFIYVLIGVIIIYSLNIFRICAMILLVLKYPFLQNFLHDVVFPLFIYGVVLVLWCLWLFKFSGHEKK
jgi:exosortase family protein XrtF